MAVEDIIEICIIWQHSNGITLQHRTVSVECADCTDCADCAGSADCADCTDCADCADCAGCADCADCGTVSKEFLDERHLE